MNGAPDQNPAPRFTEVEGANAPVPMEVIRVRGKPQATEWSLVLLSQGIESELSKSEVDGGMELKVAWEDYDRALISLQLYEQENRPGVWQKTLPAVEWWFDFRVIGWVLLMSLIYFLDSESNGQIKVAGQFNTTLVAKGEWWRAFTAQTLHSDLSHLASNLTTGILFLGVAIARYRVGAALVGVFVAGAAANGIAYWLRPIPFIGLGASGTIMAALGMVAAGELSRGFWSINRRLTIARGFLASVFLLILFGFNPQSDVLVHVAGFVMGAATGIILRPFADRQLARHRIDDGWFKAVALMLIFLPWARALGLSPWSFWF